MPIDEVRAPGTNVPVICENVAHDAVKVKALDALFAPNVSEPEYVLSAGEIVNVPPLEGIDTV